MKQKTDYHTIIHHLKHHLPAQNPLKDFVHHNTLHAFQRDNFHEALQLASKIFGYQTYWSLENFRKEYQKGKIKEVIIERCIVKSKGGHVLSQWKEKLLHQAYDEILTQKVGSLRKLWKTYYKVNPDKLVYNKLFKITSNYLDQGIAIHRFPYRHLPFLEAVRNLERNSHRSLFLTDRPRKLLFQEDNLLSKLVDIVVGDELLVEHYLFDQQFAHPGWSGMVSTLEDNPNSLIDSRKISLHDFVCFELLLEIDALDYKFGPVWKPMAMAIPDDFEPAVFAETKQIDEFFEVNKIWQEALEWSFYDEVLKGLRIRKKLLDVETKSFQAVFCIDDRECSIRRHIEKLDTQSETFGVAGFFNVAFYFQPENANFATKVCPAPITPNHIIKESNTTRRHAKEYHFHKHTHGFLGGLLASQTMGFWSAFQLGWSILFPRPTAAMVSSFKHMDKEGKLSIEKIGVKENGLNIGFTIQEMAARIEGLLKSLGLVNGFADLVYFIGHGASSTNNTHYAGYDCGACSGRAGSANARVVAYMANKIEVREILAQGGIVIPECTQFLGGLHDTTRDEIDFFDESILSVKNQKKHIKNKLVFEQALEANAVERSRRFLFIDSKKTPKSVHKEVKKRSLSLFEPRPEWNHATNALCIVGDRANNKHLFLDRRAFLNSYNYLLDDNGDILLGILNAVTPVCCGINLEYYFSKVDNHRLGAGSKLPHNVIGLIGVANGMEGDLRTGLPLQMVNIHDPLRLMVVIEHFPDKVLEIIQRNQATYEWIKNAWVNLAVIQPETREILVFENESFKSYLPITVKIPKAEELPQKSIASTENLPIYQLY